jgi:hypothetical protein
MLTAQSKVPYDRFDFEVVKRDLGRKDDDQFDSSGCWRSVLMQTLRPYSKNGNGYASSS